MTWLLLFGLARSTGACPVGTYVNGVTRDGVYRCRTKPGPELHDERDGRLDPDDAIETRAWIACPRGTHPVVTGARSVGCKAVGA